MKIIKSTLQIQFYNDHHELKYEDNELLKLARAATFNAYAPYSNFFVGAALRLKNGQIFTGCNQENASYPLCMCGERVALYTAATKFPNIPVNDLAIVARTPNKILKRPVTPCGACRQVICEYENRHNHPIKLILQADNGIYIIKEASALLPYSFDGSFLLGSKV